MPRVSAWQLLRARPRRQSDAQVWNGRTRQRVPMRTGGIACKWWSAVAVIAGCGTALGDIGRELSRVQRCSFRLISSARLSGHRYRFSLGVGGPNWAGREPEAGTIPKLRAHPEPATTNKRPRCPAHFAASILPHESGADWSRNLAQHRDLNTTDRHCIMPSIDTSRGGARPRVAHP
jgi:hypothetical protein